MAYSFYVVTGANGAIIKDTYWDARRCQKYIKRSIITGYTSLSCAEEATLDHLNNIIPISCTCPTACSLNEMITVRKLLSDQDK